MNKPVIVHSRRDLPVVTNQSQSNCDRAIACGDIDTFVVGRKRFATDEAAQKWVEFLMSESAAGRPVKYMARDPNERRTPERAKADRARTRRRASS